MAGPSIAHRARRPTPTSLESRPVFRHALSLVLIALLLPTCQRADTTDGFVFLSSRASYELVRKAARVGIPMVATISAPSSLAVSIARQAGIRLLSFCREAGYVDYTTA